MPRESTAHELPSSDAEAPKPEVALTPDAARHEAIVEIEKEGDLKSLQAQREAAIARTAKLTGLSTAAVNAVDARGGFRKRIDAAMDGIRDLVAKARKTFEKKGMPTADTASDASPDHRNRNEDAVLGDPGRFTSDRARPIKLDAGWISNTVRGALEKEAREAVDREAMAADRLKELGVTGVFDGVNDAGRGMGALASRFASSEIASVLAELPDDADAELTKKTIARAFQAADQTIRGIRGGYEGLTEEVYSTGTIMKAIDKGDGSKEIVFGHVGDSRIYVLRGRMGELEQQTVDDDIVSPEYKAGRMDEKTYREAARLLGEAREPADLPKHLRVLYNSRNVPTRGLGLIRKDQDGQPKTFVADTGTFTVQKGDLVLVATDGLYKNLSEVQIANILTSGAGSAELVGKARTEGRGIPDDISVSIMRF